jgi:hypothetical protein
MGGGRECQSWRGGRTVGIAHGFLSLTVEKMVEVEKFSQFRKCFKIEANVPDVFLDHHPDIFYLSAKGQESSTQCS